MSDSLRREEFDEEAVASANSTPIGAGVALSKVPLVTLAFWLVKICATTVGETGGDALSMTLKLGYAESTLIFLGFFLVALIAQVASKRYHPSGIGSSSWPRRRSERRRLITSTARSALATSSHP